MAASSLSRRRASPAAWASYVEARVVRATHFRNDALKPPAVPIFLPHRRWLQGLIPRAPMRTSTSVMYRSPPMSATMSALMRDRWRATLPGGALDHGSTVESRRIGAESCNAHLHTSAHTWALQAICRPTTKGDTQVWKVVSQTVVANAGREAQGYQPTGPWWRGPNVRSTKTCRTPRCDKRRTASKHT